MKQGITMLLLAFIFLCSSCEKDDASPRWSKITAFKNGEPWEAKGIGRLVKKSGSPDIIGFRAKVATSSGHVIESLGIINVPMEIGKHELTGDLYSEEARILFSHMAGDDAISAVYVADEEADNFIEIRNIDLKKMEITGIFKASFRLVSRVDSHREDPAEISFSDGNFRFKIELLHEE
jgi:hypothetical protein